MFVVGSYKIYLRSLFCFSTTVIQPTSADNVSHLFNMLNLYLLVKTRLIKYESVRHAFLTYFYQIIVLDSCLLCRFYFEDPGVGERSG